jgi:hypothetical protein
MDSKVKNALVCLLLLYMLSVMIAVVCFNIGFIREHGFAAWSLSPRRILVVGGKSLLWPFFLGTSQRGAADFSDWSEAHRANSKHFVRSIHADLESIALSNERATRQLSRAELAKMLELKRTALSEAKLVKDAVLAKAHPALPDRFRRLYQNGLELRILNMESAGGNPEAESAGLRLHEEWADWFKDNRNAINFPK